MVLKHNNQLPNQHFRKQWQNRVKTWFDQAGQKKRRRTLRAKKAAAVFPRPSDGLLRPVVRGQTFKYNTKVKAGRGFTLEELRAAKIDRKKARSLGIAVDFRRRNRSEESLKTNVDRLAAYKSKLVVYSGKNKSADIKSAKQVKLSEVFPIRAKEAEVEVRAITQEEKDFDAYTASRSAWVTAKYAGIRKKKLAEKAAAEAEAKK